MNYTQKEKFIDRLCGAVLMLIFIEILYAIVEYAYNSNFNYKDVEMWIYIGGGILLVGGSVLLAYAYMKKNGSKACYGAELVAMAFSLALLPGCYVFFPEPISKLKMIFPYLFLAYYIGKTIYIIKHRNDVTKSMKKR